MKKAILALADGTVFEGQALGFEGTAVGELVFNTSMTGYQEILTDPSYRGQMVTMTSTQIGNYGVNRSDVEARRVWAEGFVVKEASRKPSNWRSQQSLDDYLKASKVVGIEGLDTRALTRHLRDHGSQQAIISHTDLDEARIVERARTAPSIVGRDLVTDITCQAPYEWTEGSAEWLPYHAAAQGKRGRSFRVVVYDLGVKQNILRRLVDIGAQVTVVPARTPADAVKALKPDGIVLSNGPGDPEGVPYAIDAARQLIGWRPMLCICLGHQILGLAMGLKTYKLKFGHHAGNHPVKDLRSQAVEITSQNHNFAVRLDWDSAAAKQTPIETAFGRVAVSHVSLNDGSVEGMACLDHPVLSVQYHPEASPGPHDSAYLFEQFATMMEHAHA